jgi:predicted HicB family RNase H-like nuclease
MWPGRSPPTGNHRIHSPTANTAGKFVLRLTPELHAHLAVEAAEQRVSLNQWVVQKLVNRQDRHDF